MDEQRLFELIKTQLEILSTRQSVIKKESYFIKDLGLESVDLLSLFMEIERELNLDINLVEMFRNRAGVDAFSTDIRIEELIKYILSLSKK